MPAAISFQPSSPPSSILFSIQCPPWQCPPQHPPPPRDPPVSQAEVSPPLPEAANTENFLDSFVDPQCGHLEPSQLEERTKTSLSRSQLPQ